MSEEEDDPIIVKEFLKILRDHGLLRQFPTDNFIFLMKSHSSSILPRDASMYEHMRESIVEFLFNNNIDCKERAVSPKIIAEEVVRPGAKKKVVNSCLYKLKTEGRVDKITGANSTNPKWWLKNQL